MARFFEHDGKKIPDPAPDKTPEQVKTMLSDYIPELANADVRERKEGADTIYTLTRRIGTKGADPERERVMHALLRVRPKRLRIFELAAELLDERGELKLEEAASRSGEIALAEMEARAYARHTERALSALAKLRSR